MFQNPFCNFLGNVFGEHETLPGLQRQSSDSKAHKLFLAAGVTTTVQMDRTRGKPQKESNQLSQCAHLTVVFITKTNKNKTERKYCASVRIDFID